MRRFRDYQLECVDASRAAFQRRVRGLLLELATGLGKGSIIALLVKMTKDKGGRVMVLVNRDILITQLIDELKFNGVFADKEQAKDKAHATSNVVVGSIQSLKGDRLTRWAPNYFGLVITDEVHFSGSASFKTVLDHFRPARHIGLTATIERYDRAGLWNGYEEIGFRMPLYEMEDKATGLRVKGGIDEGWLCPFKFTELDVPVTLDEKLAKKAVFEEGEEVFDSQKYLPRIAEEFIRAFDGRKSLIFTTNCRVSNALAKIISSLGVDCRHVDSSYMTATETHETLDWFKSSPSGILTNAQLLKYGYNMPSIQCVGLGRPIGSPLDYKQILGRCSRVVCDVDSCETKEERLALIAASEKPFAEVVSVFWENGTHDLASPSCLITDDEDEREALNKARKAGTTTNLAELVGQLKAKRMADQEEEARKFAEQVANSQERKQRAGFFIADIVRNRNPSHKLASDAFVRYVRKNFAPHLPDGVYSGYQIMRIKERALGATK